MLLKQLEAFVQVVRLGSFSKAAEAIYLSQPTVSAHVAALERELGAKLLLRTARGAAPTEAGQLLYGYAAEMLRLRDRAERELRARGGEVRGPLTVAASTVPSQYLLPRALPGFTRRWPQVELRILQCDSGETARYLRTGEAEVGVCGAAAEDGGCVFEPILRDRLVLIAPNTEAYRGLGGAPDAARLAACPFVLREPGSGTRQETERFLESLGLAASGLRVAVQLQSTESIVQAVRHGLGVSIVSRLAAEDQRRAGGLLVFDYDSPLLDRDFYLARAKDRPLSPAAEAFCAQLRAFFREKPAEG